MGGVEVYFRNIHKKKVIRAYYHKQLKGKPDPHAPIYSVDIAPSRALNNWPTEDDVFLGCSTLPEVNQDVEWVLDDAQAVTGEANHTPTARPGHRRQS